MKILKRILPIFLLLTLYIGVYAQPVSASPIATPVLTIHSVDVYRPYIETTSDQLWLISYTIDFSAVGDPHADGTSSDLFLVRILTGGTNTEYCSYTPFAGYNGGFQKGIMSFYFSSTTQPNWAGSYDVQLTGNPGLIWTAGTAPKITFASADIDWHTGATNADITAKVRGLVINLQTVWAAAGDTSTYYYTSPKGIVLTLAGESYLTNVVYLVRTYLPDLFQFLEQPAEFPDETYDHSDADSFLDTSQGTVLDMRNLAWNLTGGAVSTQNAIGMFFIGMLCLGIAILLMMFGAQFLPALTVASFIWLASGYCRIIHLNWAIALPIIILTCCVAWKFAFSNHY